MRFSTATIASILSLSFLSGTIALPTQNSEASVQALDAAPFDDVYESSSLDKRAKIKVTEDIQGRGRKWLIGKKLDPTDGTMKTDQDLAHELAELALKHFGARSGEIT